MLLREIESFLQASRMPPARFGREAVGDSRFVFDLRDGRTPRARTVRRVNAYIRDKQKSCIAITRGCAGGRSGS